MKVVSLFVSDNSVYGQKSQVIQISRKQFSKDLELYKETVLTGQITECSASETTPQWKETEKQTVESREDVGANRVVWFYLSHCNSHTLIQTLWLVMTL